MPTTSAPARYLPPLLSLSLSLFQPTAFLPALRPLVAPHLHAQLLKIRRMVAELLHRNSFDDLALLRGTVETGGRREGVN